MGQSISQPQQQTVPGVKIDLSNIRGTTRFNDLHEELQQAIEKVDAFIQQQIAFKDQCDALMPAHEQNLSTVPSDVEYVRDQLETTQLALENDTTAIADVKSTVLKDAENARVGFRAVENLKLPQQFHYAGMWPSRTPPRAGVADDSLSDPGLADLLSYFNQTTSSLSSTLEKYQSNLSEIENHLTNVERTMVSQGQQLAFRRGKDGVGRNREDQVRELEAVLREFETGIVSVAEKVGKVREGVADVIEDGSGALGIGWR